jgi:Zn-dependent protease with chaperone function
VFFAGLDILFPVGRTSRKSDKSSNRKAIGLVITAVGTLSLSLSLQALLSVFLQSASELRAAGAVLALTGLLFRMAISRRRELQADTASVAFTQDNKASSPSSSLSVS